MKMRKAAKKLSSCFFAAPNTALLLARLFVGGGPFEPDAAVRRHRLNRGPT